MPLEDVGWYEPSQLSPSRQRRALLAGTYTWTYGTARDVRPLARVLVYRRGNDDSCRMGSGGGTYRSLLAFNVRNFRLRMTISRLPLLRWSS